MKNQEKIFSILSIIAGIIVLSTLVWAFVKYPSEQAHGERFVKDEITIIPNLVIFKPITIIVISAFVCWLCALEALRGNIIKLPMLIKRLLFVAFCVIAFVSSYEVIWNFSMWTSAHIINPNLPVDSLNHLDPIIFPKTSFNFVYFTKMFTLVLAVSLYSIFFFHTNMKEKREES